ncbi:helix-turn-helix domain-containing protein [Pontibacter burrus]|uniref:Helix-turn-helix domain-containing protein n=1 Tax=Pontibacter burrus TaxID=2704466 RepID=A0A6B3LVC8_9BACT|nr:helix-turn-helix domain-containing protein [Pontibacter burrus]NEM98206.1 helix-turn-helix domain-containing protein [Pontibacter burrus]
MKLHYYLLYYCSIVLLNDTVMIIVQLTGEQLSTLIQSAVNKALAPQTTPTPKPDRCTFDEALEITGLSKSKLYKLSASNLVPCKRYNSRLTFSRKELLNWVEEQTVEKSSDNATALLAASARRKQKRG